MSELMFPIKYTPFQHHSSIMENYQIVIIVSLVAFGWELHVAHKDTPWRISFLLEILYKVFKTFFYNAGWGFGIICTHMREILWERLSIVISRIFHPIINLLLSWKWLFVGIGEYISKYKISTTHVISSISAILVVGCAMYWYWIDNYFQINWFSKILQ